MVSHGLPILQQVHVAGAGSSLLVEVRWGSLGVLVLGWVLPWFVLSLSPLFSGGAQVAFGVC